LKIAVVHPKFGALGGGSVAMRDLVECLAKDPTHQVTVFARDWHGEIPAGVRFEKLNPPYLGSVMRDWTFERAIRRITRSAFDLVVSDQKIAGIDVYIAGGGVHIEWADRKLRAMPWWRRLLGRLAPQHLYTLRAERRLFESKALRAVVCVSQTVRRDVLRHFALPQERVHVVYNGIDLVRFAYRFRTLHRGRLRNEMGLGDKTVLLFVGGGMRNKGIFETLAAASRCGLDFELLVVGKDKRLDAFRGAAETMGISQRCRFVGPQPDVLPFYAVADIFVLPSHFETFGLVYLEALAMGIPILVSKAAGAAELIEEGRHGYRIDPNDVDDIAAKLRRLSPVAAAMAADCIALAQQYPREAMAEQLAVVLSRLIQPTYGEHDP
jgi:UDP-glucose:(heptosyl)LPS alpha-1,3-glucosyltransferase